MKRLFLLLCACLGVAANAQTGPDLGAVGLTARIAYLERAPERHSFELAMMRSVQGLERLLQTQWQYGIGRELAFLGFRSLAMQSDVGIENAPATIWRDAYTQLDRDMAEARAALAAAAPAPFLLDLSDLWLDVNQNGTREEAEGASEILGPLLFSRRQLREMGEMPSFVIRFDEADADWLIAYTHVFSAVAQFALAFDPTEIVEDLRTQRDILRNAPTIAYQFDEDEIRAEIAALLAEISAIELDRARLADDVKETRAVWQAAIAEAEANTDPARDAALSGAVDTARKVYFETNTAFQQVSRDIRAMEREVTLLQLKLPTQTSAGAGQMQAMAQQVTPLANALYVVFAALQQSPDPDHIQAVRTHLLSMIAHNRAFWDGLAQETDNDREWIPNESQDAALGIELPANIGPTWLAVLQDAEDVLEGRLLVRHPLLPLGTGVNVAAYFDDPRSLDVLDWVHGVAAYRYAARGPMITEQRWSQFSRLVNGRGALFAVFLN